MRPLQGLLSALALTLGCGGYAVQPGATVTTQGYETMTGTVRQVDVGDSTISTLYGVSLAVEIVDVTVSPQCTVSLTSGPGRLADLRPGQVIRIRYRASGDEMTAMAIEVLRNPGGA